MGPCLHRGPLLSPAQPHSSVCKTDPASLSLQTAPVSPSMSQGPPRAGGDGGGGLLALTPPHCPCLVGSAASPPETRSSPEPSSSARELTWKYVFVKVMTRGHPGVARVSNPVVGVLVGQGTTWDTRTKAMQGATGS